METMSLTLDSLFHETIGRNEVQLLQYEKLYNLPRLQYIQHTCSQTISYIQKKSGFIILVLYTIDGKIYATYDGSTRGLPGGSLKNNENMQETIERVAKRINGKIEVRDVHPMAFIDNTFCHKDNAHTLHGIVFTARIQNISDIEDSSHGGLFPLTNDFIDGVQKYGNKDILTYFQSNILPRIIQSQQDDFQDEEIETNAKMKYRYGIHNSIGKPLLRFLGISKNKIIKKRILNNCVDAKSIIDVSCGDDQLIHDLANTENIVVANDISRSQIQLLKTNKINVLRTNHNASYLPFKDKIFDIAICKNTLHHMPHRGHLLGTLYSMKRIAKKIIIVEIENPTMTGGLPKLIHKFRYRGFLKDVGGAYFNKIQFFHLINYIFEKTHKIEYGEFNTGQGKYYWAIIEII